MTNFLNKTKVYLTVPYIKRYFLYIFGIYLLGAGVALIYQTFFGAAAWDALHYNFYVGIPLAFKYIYPISSVILVIIAYLIEWKKPGIQMIVPVLLSLIFGSVVDFLVIYIPSVKEAFFLWDVLFLAVAVTLIGIGLNIIRYCNFSLPAIDQFCLAIARKFKLTFGQGKFIGEVIAMMGAVVVGLFFGTQGEFFYLGFTTIFFILFLGAIIDFFRNPVFRIFKGIPNIDIFADDLKEADIINSKSEVATSAVIENEGKIMVLYIEDRDFYVLPGGNKFEKKSLEKSLKKVVLEDTGYKINIHEEQLIINEYFMDSSYETHYFKAKLRSKPVNIESIKSKGFNIIWIEKNELLDLLNNHDTKDKFGPQIMWREFLGIINTI
jgi:uncharacterized membrane protein YczE